MGETPAIVVFARAPVAGRAKTRLIPALGHEGAAALYRCFLLDPLSGLQGMPAHVILAAAAEEDQEEIEALAESVGFSIELIVQKGIDLGCRIANAVDGVLSAGHAGTVVIGSDAPDLPADRVTRAIDLLNAKDVVLGPCSDGGYYLIGLRKPAKWLRSGITWSSGSVLRETLNLAKGQGLSFTLLDPWDDVDTPEDLAALRQRLRLRAKRGEPIFCQRTVACLREFFQGETL